MKYTRLFFLTILLTAFVDILRYLSWIESMSFSSLTYLRAIFSYLVIFFIIYIYAKNKSVLIKLLPKKINIIFKIWLLWLSINLIRGVFLANDYWDYKFLFLSSIPFTFICLVYYVGVSVYFFKYIFLTFLKRFMIVGFIFIPLTLVSNPELYSRLMIPVSIYVLFIPYLKRKWQILVISVAVTSILLVIDFRTNIIKIVFSLLILCSFHFSYILRKKVYNIIHKILFLSPVLLLLMSFNGFNVFEEIASNKYEVKGNNNQTSNMSADTRTFLYIEVFNTFESPSQLFFGLSASGSYKSIWFKDFGGAIGSRRYRTEVNILNILLYHGILGMLIYFVLLYKISYLAINKSNNKLSQMLGLLIASRWLLSFIEEFTQYDLNFYFFWLLMGLISSNYFRALSDHQIKNFLNAKNSRSLNLS